MPRNAHGSGFSPPLARLPPEPPTDPDTNFAAEPSARRGELVVRGGPAAGMRFALRDGVLTVGRSRQCECPLNDEAVSRRHFELIVSADSVRLRDLGSGNGTQVNGRRVEEAELHHGDRLMAGNSELEFVETGAENGLDHEPPVSADRPRLGLWLGVGVGAASLVIAGVISMVAHRRHTQQGIAEQVFARGLAELSGDPPDPELALADFSVAQRDLPDQRALRDATAEARDVASAIQRLARARELSDQGNVAGARDQLQGLPAGPYFDRMVISISAEIDKKEAAALVVVRPPVPVIRSIARRAREAPPKAKQPHRATVADDDRADELCDDADALLGPNPEAARRKYREALKVARPGSSAARRAQGGLEN